MLQDDENKKYILKKNLQKIKIKKAVDSATYSF